MQFDVWMGIWACWPITQSDRDFLTVGLLLGDLLDVNAPFLSVDSLNFAFSAFEDASHDLDGVSFANRDGSDIILSFQFLVQMAAHDLPSLVRGCGEMSFSGLPSLAGHAYGEKG